MLGIIVAAIAVLALTGTGSYLLGYKSGQQQTRSTSTTQSTNKVSTLKVPSDATVISSCAKGRGAQYVLPKDIPHGPVYNIYQGKITGLEFMIGKDELLGNKSYLSLPLYGQMYDHIDVGLLSQGHAGYPEPHYHVDVYNITPAESAAITCS